MRFDANFAENRKSWLQEVPTVIPLLIVWGVEWIISACFYFTEQWFDTSLARNILYLTALFISVALVLRLRQQQGKQSEWRKFEKFLLPGIMLLTAVMYLQEAGGLNYLFVILLQAFLLSICYVQFGFFLGKQLIYLGLWLFAFTIIIGSWYLGYVGEILNVMGGLSLLSCGYMLSRWKRHS